MSDSRGKIPHDLPVNPVRVSSEGGWHYEHQGCAFYQPNDGETWKSPDKGSHEAALKGAAEHIRLHGGRA